MAGRRVRIIVRGRVQGVFFRASTRSQAESLGVTGAVKNLADGSVEVIAEGSEASLRDLVSWCRRGPPGAQVSEIEESWADGRDEFAAFRVSR